MTKKFILMHRTEPGFTIEDAVAWRFRQQDPGAWRIVEVLDPPPRPTGPPNTRIGAPRWRPGPGGLYAALTLLTLLWVPVLHDSAVPFAALLAVAASWVTLGLAIWWEGRNRDRS